MIVLMAKLPSKVLPLASVYRPTAQVHAANNALMVQAYKHMTEISRHAHTEALWGPWEHGRQGTFDLVLTPVAGCSHPRRGPARCFG